MIIIAEAGINHNGSVETAKKLIDMAVDCRADVVKFQIFKMSELPENQQNLAKYCLPFEAFKELKEYCGDRIQFNATPDGVESLEYVNSLGVPFIKVGSGKANDWDFLRHVADTGKPVVLSTGKSTFMQVQMAKNLLGSCMIALHCVSNYPTMDEDAFMKRLENLKTVCPAVGYSDHTLGFTSAIMAVGMGASVIEKHITLDNSLNGPDHMTSMEPDRFKYFVREIRRAESML